MSAPRDSSPGAGAMALVDAVRRRVRLRDVLVAGAVGLGVAAGSALVLPRLNPAVILVAAGVTALLVFRRGSSRRSRPAAARLLETELQDSKNVLITAEELDRHPDRAQPFVRHRVLAEADRIAGGVSASSIVRDTTFLAPGVAIIGFALLLVWQRQIPQIGATLEHVAQTVSQQLNASSAPDVLVEVVPPAYTGAGRSELRNPNQIDALAGTRLTFKVGTTARIRFGDRSVEPPFIHPVEGSGYFVIENEGSAERRFIPLAAIADRTPVVRIETPGKDLLLPAADRTIDLAVSASDDLGLGTLELKYTKISGTGEQFEFVEGTLPIGIEKRSDREWRGRSGLSLKALALAPGDALVYHAVARDRRTGDAGLASSDTFYIEILGPGQIPLEGVEMPPELERYGMSQQMIVLKLERLRAEEKGLSQDVLTEKFASLAAEQRTVRANFVFLLGGHVEDEEVEAEQSHEIQEGRLENTARRDINAAVGHMTRAEGRMTSLESAPALTAARDAVTALQRAFGRNRYLLRSLASRSKLDPTRRETGDTNGALDWRRTVDAADRPENSAAGLLNELLESSASVRVGSATELERLAERILAIDPADAKWVAASRRLLEARNGSPQDREAALQDAADALRAEANRAALPRPAGAVSKSALERAYRAERKR